jgi:hypothetical protein
VGELSADAGLNSRVPHLERESIFGSAKRKLIFLLGMIVILINTIG